MRGNIAVRLPLEVTSSIVLEMDGSLPDQPVDTAVAAMRLVSRGANAPRCGRSDARPIHL